MVTFPSCNVATMRRSSTGKRVGETVFMSLTASQNREVRTSLNAIAQHGERREGSGRECVNRTGAQPGRTRNVLRLTLTPALCTLW